MGIRKSPTETALILQNHVGEAIRCIGEASNHVNSASQDCSSLHSSFLDIEKELKHMNDQFFPKFKRCDEALLEHLTTLEKLMDVDCISDSLDQKDRIDSIKKTLGNIRNLKSKIHLPEPESATPQSQREDLSHVPDRKVSIDWLRLSVEENILDSPAMANLQQSYDILGTQMKLCLLCLAIFPANAVVKKKPLIYWWIGEGLISKRKDVSAEEVGESIFAKLIEKGLIKPSHKGINGKNPVVDACTMNPWIRRMLIAVAGRAQFFDFDRSGNLIDEHSESSRACLLLRNPGSSGTNLPKEEELFTIYNVNENYLSFKPEFFLKLKKLLTLQLGRWQQSSAECHIHIEVENEEFLNELWAQRHLRYLSLQGISGIIALPPSVSKCVNLEILDLRACHNLERLPPDIGSLRKLTHLDVSQCYLLESMPKGIEKLSSLQVLKGFVIGHSRKSHCKLADLAQLKKLRKLKIHIGSKSVIGEGDMSKLKEIVSLRILTISWGGVAIPSNYQEQGSTKKSSNGKEGLQLRRSDTLTMMKSLHFPPKLEKLDLRCFPRPRCEWLRPSNLEELKKLYIRGGELESLISEENKKWKVMILRLKYLKNLNLEWPSVKKDFSNLVYFEKIRCHQTGEPSQYEPDVEWCDKDER